MAGTLFRSVLNNTLSAYRNNTTAIRTINTSSVFYAARKGTRAKARAKKVKVEVTKVGFIPHNQRGKKTSKTVVNKHFTDLHKPLPIDDVYAMKYYRWIVYTAEDAVKAHQETHHPSMFNDTNAYIFAKVELNMEGIKKNKFVESFTRLSLLPHPFPREEERTILAFCKGPELAKEVTEAGATTAGGVDIIKKIQDGTIKLSEYEYIVAHPNIITDLVPIRGLMKKRFPSLNNGCLNPNLAELVKKFSGGIQYKVLKDELQPIYGSVEVPVGRLNMDSKQIAENIEALLKDVQAARPKRDGLFVTACFLTSPPSTEIFKIDPFVHIDRTLSKEVQEDSDDEDDAVAVKA